MITCADLLAAPRFLETPRTWMAAPEAAHLPVRTAWSAANFDALVHVAWWRNSADPAVAERSLASELASLAAGQDLIFNVFEKPYAAITIAIALGIDKGRGTNERERDGESKGESGNDGLGQRAPRCSSACPAHCPAHSPYVGRIDLHSWDFDAPRCEIGYMSDVRTRGRGLLQEAAQACIALAFAMGVVRVEAMTDPRNASSIRFAKALGLRHEALMRNYERDADGALCDQVLLAITP